MRASLACQEQVFPESAVPSQNQAAKDEGQYPTEGEMQDLVPLKRQHDYEWRRSRSTYSSTQRAASTPDVTTAFSPDGRAFVSALILVAVLTASR